jgi:hypothetical protein
MLIGTTVLLKFFLRDFGEVFPLFLIFSRMKDKNYMKLTQNKLTKENIRNN